MKLNYRGSSYEAHIPAVDATDGEIRGIYRGAKYQQPYVRHIPVPQPAAQMKYRGASYERGDRIDVEFMFVRRHYAQGCGTSEAGACNAIVPKVSYTSDNSSIADDILTCRDVNHIHLANIRKNLERRLQIAKAKGDTKLVRLLEMEAQDIA